VKSLNDVIGDWKFAGFDVERWSEDQVTIKLEDTDAGQYFMQLPNGRECFVEGTDLKSADQGVCVCMDGYHGDDCGIPDAVFAANFKKDLSMLKRRNGPARRLIHGVLVNHEFDFFEARVGSIGDIVDAFIVQESNFTTFGSSKELEFLQV